MEQAELQCLSFCIVSFILDLTDVYTSAAKRNFICNSSCPEFYNMFLYCEQSGSLYAAWKTCSCHSQTNLLCSYAVKLSTLKKHSSYGAVHHPFLWGRFAFNSGASYSAVIRCKELFDALTFPHPSSSLSKSPKYLLESYSDPLWHLVLWPS
jgi:hypothetical protein